MESGGADDGDEHDVGLREGGEFSQSFRAEVDFHIGREQGAEGCFLGGVVNGDVADTGFAGLGGEFPDVAGCGEGDDFDLTGHLAGDLEGGAADGAGRS